MPKRTLEELTHHIERLEAQSAAVMEAQNQLHASIERLSAYARKLHAMPLAVIDERPDETPPSASQRTR
jgi:hypothetical protein